MPHLFRFLSRYLLVALLLFSAACTKKSDPDPQPQPGSISGQVTPAGAITTVTATDTGGRTYAATPNAAGSYQISGLPAGSYVLSFATSSAYQTPASVVVTVAAGTVTQVPVVTVQASTGSVSGQVTPADALTAVTATDATGRVTTATVTPTGAFTLSGLAPGTYTITYTAAPGYQAPANAQVVVIGGQNAVIPPITVVSNTSFLTNRNWRVTAFTYTSNGQMTNEYALMPSCERDNFIRFNLPNSLITDEGATKCNATDPQTSTSTWALTNNGTSLTAALVYLPALPYSVVTINSTTLQLRLTVPSASTFDITYTSF